MGFRSIRTYHFRNLAEATLDVDARDVFLIGENGQGKTNFLEAIYSLCYGGSFRSKSKERICREGENEFSLTGWLATETNEHRIVYKWQRGRRTLELDSRAISDRKELVHTMPCIVFGHEDIELVNGPPEMQRFFFDQSLTLHDPRYLDVLRRYRRILKSRNNALKEQQEDLLEVYDVQLAEHGIELQEKRAAAIGEFNETFGTCFSRVSGFAEPIDIVYHPSWGTGANQESVGETLIAQRDRDLRFGTTTSGPHRDRYRFIMGNRDFTETASTGQLRLLSLVLRVSQAVFFHAATERKPLLLLDDVLLELDQRRRERFLEILPEYEQAFFTFLPNEPYRRYLHRDARLYWVEAGSLSPMETEH